MNPLGLFVLLLGVVLIIVGIKNTYEQAWNSLLPGFAIGAGTNGTPSPGGNIGKADTGKDKNPV